MLPVNTLIEFYPVMVVAEQPFVQLSINAVPWAVPYITFWALELRF